jgi:hypothetical protein
MNKHGKTHYFYSLRVRYAGIAILFALIILASASAAYQTLKTARHSTTDSIEGRHQLQQRTRHIRDAIWLTHESLQMFLFNPQKDVYRLQIHSSINQAIMDSDQILTQNKDMANDALEKIRRFKNLLLRLDKSITRLIDIRTSATEQYPALAYARGSMLGHNSNFVTAASLAIEESFTESDKVYPKDIYNILVQARHYWSLIISNFRMYLANRLGTFDNNVFEIQIHDIETQYETLQEQLHPALCKPCLNHPPCGMPIILPSNKSIARIDGVPMPYWLPMRLNRCWNRSGQACWTSNWELNARPSTM